VVEFVEGQLKSFELEETVDFHTHVLCEFVQAVGESKRLVVQSPWSQLTSECQRFGHPPRLNN
jgi:hypothetical protein